MREAVTEVMCNVCFKSKIVRNNDPDVTEELWIIVDGYDICNRCIAIIENAESIGLIDNSRYLIRTSRIGIDE